MHPKIMLVDDEPDVCEAVCHYFSKRDYKVVTATSGEEALSKLLTEKPALILLDIYMPKMDGIECLQRIRELDKEVLVIMVTCANDKDKAKRCLELGATDYIVKPLGYNALELAVITHLFLKSAK
jgi:DNA-binding response OmpR family regulator